MVNHYNDQTHTEKQSYDADTLDRLIYNVIKIITKAMIIIMMIYGLFYAYAVKVKRHVNDNQERIEVNANIAVDRYQYTDKDSKKHSDDR